MFSDFNLCLLKWVIVSYQFNILYMNTKYSSITISSIISFIFQMISICVFVRWKAKNNTVILIIEKKKEYFKSLFFVFHRILQSLNFWWLLFSGLDREQAGALTKYKNINIYTRKNEYNCYFEFWIQNAYFRPWVFLFLHIHIRTYLASAEEGECAVEAAIKCGYRMIDTASFYISLIFFKCIVNLNFTVIKKL